MINNLRNLREKYFTQKPQINAEAGSARNKIENTPGLILYNYIVIKNEQSTCHCIFIHL